MTQEKGKTTMFPLCEGCLYFIEGECTNDTNVSVEECYRPRKERSKPLTGEDVVEAVQKLGLGEEGRRK